MMEATPMDSLKNPALIAVKDCMGVKEDEKVLVIADEPSRKIGYALFEAAKGLNAETVFLEITPRMSNGEEPPGTVAELMKLQDVILIPTSMSMSHTEARREASAAGARIATLPGITEDIMTRTLKADYFAIAKRSAAAAELLTLGSTVRITTPKGTDFIMSIEGRTGLRDTGLNHNAGSFSNLPAGEGFIAPVEGASNGVIRIDGSMAGVGLLDGEEITVVVEDGYATEITGGAGAQRLLSIMEPHGRLAFNVAELGIGTNDQAELTGNVLEDEKIMGTVHIAFGDNKTMGGTVRVASHLDGVILRPTVYIDDRVVIEDGNFLIE